MKDVLKALTELQVRMPVQTILIVMAIAIIIAAIIYITYKHTYTGVVYNPRFNVSLVMITLITTIVMVVIGSNISVSLGMVGALSIIRFRTAVKDPRDTAFIFWGVVAGLACGTQNYYIAIIGSIILCLVLFAFKKFMNKDNKYTLIIKGTGFDLKEVEAYLKKDVKSYMCKGKYINKGNIELIYDIKFETTVKDDVISHLYHMDGIEIVNIVSSNTDTMG